MANFQSLLLLKGLLTTVVDECSLSSLAIQVDDPVDVGGHIGGRRALVHIVDIEVERAIILPHRPNLVTNL